METSGTAPGPRSGCCMATLQDGRILVYGGFCKEKAKKGKKEDEGKTMADMYLLVPDSELIIYSGPLDFKHKGSYFNYFSSFLLFLTN